MMEKTIKSEIAYQGPFLKVQRDLVELPDSKTFTREFILHPGAALTICINEKKEFLVSKQYRHAVGRVVWEFPAGKRDGTEDSLATAHRELREETGLIAEDMDKIGRLHPCVGYANEFIDVFLVTKFKIGPASPDVGEQIESEWMSKQRLVGLINSGELTDGKSLAALTLLMMR